MSEFLIHNPTGFPFGFTSITRIGEASNDTGIDFGILKMKKGESIAIVKPLESAYLLIDGECEFICDDKTRLFARHSCFDEAPCALHLAPHATATIRAITDCEFAVSQVENQQHFASQIYDASNLLDNEHRGKGKLNDTACRIVRTIFDKRNAPNAKLVLGEVVTAPGRWSSYPPHHHAHPEIYHYRFTESQGYGHAECGDDVFKVKQFDTYKILDRRDHAQVAAPGYGMYYIWVIRHLDHDPYIAPEFTKEHHWTTTEEANERAWKSKF